MKLSGNGILMKALSIMTQAPTQDMEEEPGDWVAHQAEVDTLINKIQV